MSGILDLHGAGYRRFGPVPGTPGVFDPQAAVRVLREQRLYDEAGLWVRRRGRRAGQEVPPGMRVVARFDPNSAAGSYDFGFIDDYFRSEFASAGLPLYTTDGDTLHELIGLAERDSDRWRGMHRITQAMAFSGQHRLGVLVREHVLPLFFRLYPAGRVVVVRGDHEFDTMTAAMRVLYVSTQVRIDAANRHDVTGVRTMQAWHQGSILQAGALLLDLFLYLFYPAVAGFRAGPPGLDFVFLFDPPEEYTPAIFPRNWLAWAGSTASFGKEEIDFDATMRDFNGPLGRRAAHQRHQFARGHSIGDLERLLDWYIGRANRLLYEATDLANFTDRPGPDGVINPVAAFEHLLSFDRLLRKTTLSATAEDAGAARQLVFEAAELYDALSEFFENHSGGSEFFKRLFDTAAAPGFLAPRLRRLPPPFGEALADLAAATYARLQEAVVGSVWMRSKVTPDGVLVRNKALTAEVLVPFGAFVADVVRCYRNGHHGYFTSERNQARPSRYLFLVDGDLPAEMTALPILWWLAYLADPGLVGFNHLTTGLPC